MNKLIHIIQLVNTLDDEIVSKELEINDIKHNHFRMIHEIQEKSDSILFRESIRQYRIDYGINNLKIEIELLQKYLKRFMHFYVLNKLRLDNIDIQKLRKKSIQYYLDSWKNSQNDLKVLSIEYKKANDALEATAYNLSIDEDEKQYRKVHFKAVYDQYKRLQSVSNERYKTYNSEDIKSRKISDFKNLSTRYCELIRILELDYLAPQKYISNKIINLSLDIFNNVFTPALDEEDLVDFLNNLEQTNFELTHIPKKKMQSYFVIWALGETINNKEKKDEWLIRVLTYFNYNKVDFDKKYKSSKETELSESLIKKLSEYL